MFGHSWAITTFWTTRRTAAREGTDSPRRPRRPPRNTPRRRPRANRAPVPRTLPTRSPGSGPISAVSAISAVNLGSPSRRSPRSGPWDHGGDRRDVSVLPPRFPSRFLGDLRGLGGGFAEACRRVLNERPPSPGIAGRSRRLHEQLVGAGSVPRPPGTPGDGPREGPTGASTGDSPEEIRSRRELLRRPRRLDEQEGRGVGLEARPSPERDQAPIPSRSRCWPGEPVTSISDPDRDGSPGDRRIRRPCIRWSCNTLADPTAMVRPGPGVLRQP